jgi:hypothetical protein
MTGTNAFMGPVDIGAFNAAAFAASSPADA